MEMGDPMLAAKATAVVNMESEETQPAWSSTFDITVTSSEDTDPLCVVVEAATHMVRSAHLTRVRAVLASEGAFELASSAGPMQHGPSSVMLG